MDTTRMLIVFAEVNDYAADVTPDGNWPAGELPLNADSWIDADFTGAENIIGELTRYYYQASFGNFIVLGDYVDTLLSNDSASLTDIGDRYIVSFINSLGGTDLITARGKSVNNDFDYVTIPASAAFGIYKTRASDNYIDLHSRSGYFHFRAYFFY
ncbi:MAG: hypothetical protein ACK4IY_05770 [Chitinophagales bacterium]